MKSDEKYTIFVKKHNTSTVRFMLRDLINVELREVNDDNEEFIKYHHEFNLSSPCIEHDLKKFLLKSNNCLILNGQFIMGIKTNYYLSDIYGIC